MYKEFYQLSTEPFRLTPDPRFVFAHRSYRKAQAYMQHALEQGDGVLVITGRSGTGKTTLVEDFRSALESENILTATLVSTQLEVDDLLRMLAYAFGLEARGLDKATLLHDLEKFLTHQPRALLIIDEAQNLSTAALEEVRMLTNMHVRSRPLLQIFMLGQEHLQRRLLSPEMEQLHQRLMAACDLQPLSLQETHDYVLHRLGCAGWQGDPIISNATFVLIHRFSQGLPRYISKLCARLFLHGGVERRHRLEVDDLMTVIQEIQGELLLPSMPNKESDGDEPLPGMQELIESKSLPADWMVYLTATEQAFIEHNPVATKAPSSAVMAHPEDAAGIAVTPQRPNVPASALARQSAAERTQIRSMAPLTNVYDYRGDVDDYAGEPEIYRRKFGKGKLIGYGIAASAILLSAFYIGIYSFRLQTAPVAYNPALYRIDGTAVTTPSAEQPPSDTAETKPLITDAIEAVGLLPRTRKARDDTAAMTDAARQGAALAPANSDTLKAQGNIAATEMVPEPVAKAEAAPTISNDAQNADTSTMRTDSALSINPLATDEQQPKTLLTSSTQTLDDSSRAKAVEVPRALPATDQSFSDDMTDASRTAATEAEPAIAIESLAYTPATSIDGSTGTYSEAKASTGENDIQHLLLLGDQALAKNRLRFPEEQSAWHYYKQVLALEPGNLAAQQGLQRIAGRYAWLASDMMETQQYVKAKTFIKRGLGVVAGDSELLALQREAEERHAELLEMQERERMLALQASEAKTLAEAANRTPRIEREAEAGDLFGTLKGLFNRGETQDPEQIFQINDR